MITKKVLKCGCKHCLSILLNVYNVLRRRDG
jgi:hypothetical protein